MNQKTSKIIWNFLKVYWARPEVAIWRTLDVLKLKNHFFEVPSMDLGCGDGVFTFTLLGGETDIAFDVYQTISTKRFWKNVDVYDQPAGYRPKIIKKVKKKMDFGVDWKQNLLDKAKNLKTYKKLIKHDLNRKLPFQTRSIKSIFSNVFYWIDNLPSLISESYRILKNDGDLIICVPDEKFRDNLIYQRYILNHQKWAKMLDRGIYNNIKHCYSYDKWCGLFKEAGFEIEHHTSYLSKQFVQFWNIGLRPYSPYLIEMANRLDQTIRKKIKQRLLQEIYPIISSYVEYELSLKSDHCFHFFILKK